MPSDKAHGASKNISDNASAVSRDSRSKALATAPHLNPTHVAHLSHSSTPNRTKKPPCAQQESQCARRLKERIAQKGGLKSLFYFFKKKYLMLFLIKYAPAIAISPKYKGVADIAPPPPPSDE